MSERTYETWQVMRLLSRHRDWRAEAPETDEWGAVTATVFDDHSILVEGIRGYKVAAPIRSDWRIIKPKKSAREVVTRVSGATSLRFEDGSGVARLTGLDPSKTYRLVEVDE